MGKSRSIPNSTELFHISEEMCLLLVLFNLLVFFSFLSIGHSNDDFYDVSIKVPSNETRTPVTFYVHFTIGHNFDHRYGNLSIVLPRFTRRFIDSNSSESRSHYDIHMGGVRLAPSTLFNGAWHEGEYLYASNDSLPYEYSKLTLSRIFGDGTYTISAGTAIILKIYDTNGIGIACGFPSSFIYYNHSSTGRINYMPFSMLTNATNSTYAITQYDGVGTGCTHYRNCSGHGICDYCTQKCSCSEGYGSSSDIITIGRDVDNTCSQRVCPSGKVVRGLPRSPTFGHHMRAECSGNGVCDRLTGECKCYPPFNGSACERMRCPNDCSGHGQCLSMTDISRYYGQESSFFAYEYGTASTMTTTTWDFDVIYGCVCDSSWKVGFGANETQLPEYFGPDCSLRHCPTGDDPDTPHNELNCHNVSQTGAPGKHYGHVDNICHIDCSNRGVCDFKSGECRCFQGFWGINCGFVANRGTKIKEF